MCEKYFKLVSRICDSEKEQWYWQFAHRQFESTDHCKKRTN